MSAYWRYFYYIYLFVPISSCPHLSRPLQNPPSPVCQSALPEPLHTSPYRVWRLILPAQTFPELSSSLARRSPDLCRPLVHWSYSIRRILYYLVWPKTFSTMASQSAPCLCLPLGSRRVAVCVLLSSSTNCLQVKQNLASERPWSQNCFPVTGTGASFLQSAQLWLWD